MVITTTDHKVIGNLYLVTSFVFFLFGGVMALIMRANLAQPGSKVVSDDTYNQLFTMHGTIMLLLFATPLFVGFANAIMPLQIGAPDVAFPRLNMFSYWLFLFGGLITVSGFIAPGGAASFGWFAYAPLNNAINSPGIGGDLWVMGLWMAGLGTILGAVNFVTTIFTMRAPGMTMFRMPIFCWNMLVTSMLVLIAFPIFAAALLALEADRRLGAHVFDAANGGADPVAAPVLVLRPSRGLHHRVAVLRHHHRGPAGLQPQADLRLHRPGRCHAHHRGAVGGGVGAPHVRHRCGRPGVLLLHDVPHRGAHRGEVLQLDRHDVGGSLTFDTPMLFSLGFLTTFLFGGLTGVILASPPLDFQVSDSYFVVAHFHYVVFGTVVFAMFAGFYFWWPKLTGRMLDERLGKIHFWLLFIGFHMTFLVQHWLGVEGMPRRYADYGANDGFTTLNEISSIGAFLLGASTLPFLYNVWKSRKNAARRARRPVGLGPVAGVGHELAAAAAQLRVAAAHPVGEPGLRPAPPGGRGARAPAEPGGRTARRLRRRSRRRGSRRGARRREG